MKAPQPFTTLGLRSLIAVAVGFATVANAAPLQRRLPIPADQINGFPQLVPPGITGQVYLAFQPLLDVSNGCVPFPAVDGNGNTKSVPLIAEHNWEHDLADGAILWWSTAPESTYSVP